MSNVRPWFRLSSIARPTSQGSSDPPPPPRQTPSGPAIVTPPTKQPSPPSPPRQPPSPPRQQTPAPPPPQERSPYHSPSSRHTSTPTTPTKTKSPLSTPPRSLYTPPPISPEEVQEALPPPKPTSPPSPAHSTRSLKYESESFRKVPSPRVLSPSERETAQKNILTAEKTSQLLHEPNHYNNSENTHHQQSQNLMRTRFITIAGENKGAVMEIIQSPSSSKTRGGTHSSEKGRRVQSISNDEGEGKKNHNNNGNNKNLPMKAFINSNVQMINNSIVYNSTATHHDPGIHLKIYRKLPVSGTGSPVKDYGNNGRGYTN